MPLVNAKCTNCGANLAVDKAKDAAICQYCGSAFIVEKAINNYNVVNNINAGVVNVYGATNDFDIRGGVLVKYNGSSVNPIIPLGVIKIGSNAFCNAMIKSVFIPETVEEISSNGLSHGGFAGCDELETISFSEGIKFIRIGAFKNCKSIKKIIFPKSLVMIERDAFSDCISLEKIQFLGDTELSIGAFSNCSKLAQVTFPNGNKKSFDFNNYVHPYDFKSDDQWELKRIKKAQDWKNNNLCSFCGGNFKGIFNKVCVRCGRKKDY